MRAPSSSPCSYALPGLMQSVSPMRACPRASWMWPCSESAGWVSSIAVRTAFEPTRLGSMAAVLRCQVLVQAGRVVEP